jgi:hypothetical protein
MEPAALALSPLANLPELRGNTEISLAFAGLQPDMESITPRFALALAPQHNDDQAPRPRPTHPLAALLPDAPRIPARWNGLEGLRIPLWGEALSLCLAANETIALAATQEPLMDHITRSLKPPATANATLLLQWNWARAAHDARLLLDFLARAELITRTPQEVQRDFGPLLEALPGLGTLRIEGLPDGPRWRFHGQGAEPTP